MRPTECIYSQCDCIAITYYYNLLHISVLSGPLLERKQIYEMYRISVCIFIIKGLNIILLYLYAMLLYFIHERTAFLNDNGYISCK